MNGSNRVILHLAAGLAELGSIEFQRLRWVTFSPTEIHEPTELFSIVLDDCDLEGLIARRGGSLNLSEATIVALQRALDILMAFVDELTDRVALLENPEWIKATEAFAHAAIRLLEDFALYGFD